MTIGGNEMKENARFISKVAGVHIITYLICGLVFSQLFNYEELFNLGNTKYFMREAYGLSSLIGPIFQIVRGILFGFILLLIKDSFLEKPYGWLKLWAVVAGLGIICTPGAAPASMEGIIYSQLPLEFHLKVAPELLIQTLLFSILVTDSISIKIPDTLRHPFIVTAIAGGLFSVCGIILALVLDVDFMKSATDIGAFVVMFVALAVVFFMSKYYFASKVNSTIYYFICYIALAVSPTIYNYMSDSLLKSPLSLIISGFPVIGMWIYCKIINNNHSN